MAEQAEADVQNQDKKEAFQERIDNGETIEPKDRMPDR